MFRIFSKKCHLCGKEIEGKAVTRDVKVHGYYGLNRRHFCSMEHYEKYQKLMKQYEKKRKIPMESGCVACMGRPRRV